jgi:hypothetical protein
VLKWMENGTLYEQKQGHVRKTLWKQSILLEYDLHDHQPDYHPIHI